MTPVPFGGGVQGMDSIRLSEESNSYEEIRRRNVERNENFMRLLGLPLPREGVKQPCNSVRSSGNANAVKKVVVQCRRSARIAKLSQLHSDLSGSRRAMTLLKSCISRPVEGRREEEVKERKAVPELKRDAVEGMENYDIMEEDYSTEGSSDSFHEEKVDREVHVNKSFTKDSLGKPCTTEKQGTSSNIGSVDTGGVPGASTYGTHFQEMFMRAFMQSAATLVGPAFGMLPTPEGVSRGGPLMLTSGVCSSGSTWKEEAYNKAQARRKRKLKMDRTSAGEGSDSQEEFPVPEGESLQQRSVRTRRLNRARLRRAKELTCNRKAVNKVPYVIHIDGTGKARGIHRHTWRAAVRGQCGRLDPTMDNINHHPKHVVDSIWHALEKEWEFEGYAHRAREMFEKAATKYMRNRKMQLKYKCLKTVDAKKPDDVNGVYWNKIVDLTRKSKTQVGTSNGQQSTGKGKEKIFVEEEEEQQLLLQVGDGKSGRVSPDDDNGVVAVFGDDDDVSARIRSLQSELLRLQNYNRDGYRRHIDVGRGNPRVQGYEGLMSDAGTEEEVMKENVSPGNGEGIAFSQRLSRMPSMKVESEQGMKVLATSEDTNKLIDSNALQELDVNESKEDFVDKEMDVDCGDIVRLFALSSGRKKEVGKGIVMGLSGSKFGKKVIPQGWYGIKITACTYSGGGEACPLPTSWTEPMKHKTVKEANGRTILWPVNLLQSLLQT